MIKERTTPIRAWVFTAVFVLFAASAQTVQDQTVQAQTVQGQAVQGQTTQGPLQAQPAGLMSFRRVAPQWIAAQGDPDANSGTGAERWGLWQQDPGPRGVKLEYCPLLTAANGVAPAGWRYDAADWWLEEHGLIMERPVFPLPAGRYVVTGGRRVKAVLTVDPPDQEGHARWELSSGARLKDVTHLPCRAARYQAAQEGECSPDQADQQQFPVKPGAAMPEVDGCRKQDYAVLIVIGVAVQ